MDLNATLVFVRVIQAGSFSGAAKVLEMPTSTVSAKVATLEKDLGVSLIQRTTRRMRLTESGEIYFQHAVRAVGELALAQTLTKESQSGMQGRVRVTAPVEVGMSTVADCVSAFLAKHPQAQVDLVLTDRVVDMVSERVDIAIRFGDLRDSSLIAKKIGRVGNEAFAAPAYLKKAPSLVKPQDLVLHSCLIFTNTFEGAWTLERKTSGGPSGDGAKGGKDRTAQKVLVKGAFSANNLIALHRLALDGRGVALLPPYLCQDDVEKKRLIPVLDGWATRQHPIHLLHAPQLFLPRTTRALLDHLSESMHGIF